MTWKRILYLAVVVAALLLMVYTDSFLSAFFLAAVVALPVVSLLVSLPAMTACQVRLEPLASQVSRGQETRWRITVENRRHLPLSRIILRLRLSNCMTGESSTVRLRLSGASTARSLFLPVNTTHCGMLTCSLIRCRVLDGMGLFSIRRREVVDAMLPVMPLPDSAEQLPDLPGGQPEASALRVHRGSGSGEDYDLRPYRPGDPVRLIHWKLSSKRDELIFREVLETEEPIPVLTFDHVGTPEDMDRLLDRLDTLCQALLEHQREHVVCWLHPGTGALREFRITGERERNRCFQAILEDPSPLTGHKISEEPQALPNESARFHVHLEKEQEEAI